MRRLRPTRKSCAVVKPRRIWERDGDQSSEGSVWGWSKSIVTIWGEVDGRKRGDCVQRENHALSSNRAEFGSEIVTSRVKGVCVDGLSPFQQSGARWMAGNEGIVSNVKITRCRQTVQNLGAGW